MRSWPKCVLKTLNRCNSTLFGGKKLLKTIFGRFFRCHCWILPAVTALCVAPVTGAGDGDTAAGPGGGEEEKRGAGEATAGGDESQAEAGGA